MTTIDKHAKRFLIFVTALFGCCNLNAQIEVTPANTGIFTPESLITNVFLDEGVEVSTITYDGRNASVGYFTNGEIDMGIDRGIVMTSGFAVTAATPNNAGGTGNISSGFWSNNQEPDLAAIASGGINDLARYEITFVPTADTLRFKYVFASEEYPEYACSNFNDVFGFFISGPNPSGGNYVGENIALIPDPANPDGTTFTNLPVTINNVNSGSVGSNGSFANCSPPNGSLAYGQYYNNNAGSNTMTYDAYLNIFIAQAIVVPCETYTIKLAISDVGDGFFDSAVFLEAKSFGTGALDVETATVSLDGTLSESCSDAAISFILPSQTETDLFLDYEIIGTATNGVDYNFIPDDLFIPAGDSVLTINIEAYEDTLIEDAESIGFDILIDPCTRDTFWVYIRDNDIVPPELGPDLVLCLGDSAQLDGTLPVPLPEPPTFVNTETININPHDTEFISEIQVFGIQPFTLAEGVIKRICIDSLHHSWVDDIDIYLVAPGGQFLELSTDNGGSGNDYIECCFTPDATVPINFPGPFAPPEATPFTGNWLPEGVWEDLWSGDNPTNGFWKLVVLDDSQGFSGTLKGWSICFEPIRQFYYEWEPSEGLSCDDCPDPIAKPEVTTLYHLTATDNYGCSVEDSILIEVFDEMLPPVVTCNDPTENSVGITWETVVGADSYEINMDSTGWVPANGLSQTVDNLLLGECVTFDVRGVGLCTGQVQTIECCVPDCALSEPIIDFAMDASCYNYADGSLGVTATTVDPPLSYSIEGFETNDTGIFNGLPAGNYIVNIVDTLNCSTAAYVTIGQPDSLISNPIVINDVDCNGSDEGLATFEISGGLAPFQFAWSDTQMDSLAANLVQGDYFVTITDQNNCSITDSVSIAEPEIISITFDSDSLLCAADNSGTIEAIVSGGTGAYSYAWSNGQTDSLAVNLAAGFHSVTVTDENNCIAIDSIEIFEPEALSSSTTQINVGCSEGGDGSANVIPTGGTPPYSFLWDNGDLTSETLNLPAGQHIVSILDANGCSIADTVDIIEAEAILLEADSTAATCFNGNDGTATIIPSGGTGNFQFLWNDPLAQTTDVATGLTAGVYEVTVTDENNCEATSMIAIGQAEEIVLTNSFTDLNCYEIPDGTIDITASGGTMPYTYLWSNAEVSEDLANIPAGNYSVIVTDANNCTAVDTINIAEPDSLSLSFLVDSVACNGGNSGSIQAIVSGGTGTYSFNWDNGQTLETAIDLTIGNYALTVTDINGCEISGSTDVFEPEALSATTDQTDVTCFEGNDGLANVTVSGGTPPYSYLWSNGENTPIAQNLAAGQHIVSILDANDCSITDTVDITEAEQIVLTTDFTNVSCFNGSDGTSTVTASGGTGAFQYLWNDPLSQTTAMAENLVAGEYTVTVTDEVGCMEEVNTFVDQATAIEITTIVSPVNCNGGNDGTADVTVNGGTPPYSFAWSNGATTEDLQNLEPEIYALTVTDNLGCTEMDDAEILVPLALAAESMTTDVLCYGGVTGAIDVLPGGGVAPYNFAWSNGAVTEDLTSLAAGDYTLTMTDANNCTFTMSLAIQQPLEPVNVTIATPELICYEASNGTATVTVSGGTPPYSYLWDNTETTATAIALDAGTHFVTVTDSEDCDYIASVVQEQYQPIIATLDVRNPFCHDGEGSAIVSTVRYGNLPANLNDFTFAWSNGTDGLNNNNLTADASYTVTVSNAIGCTGTATAFIQNPPEMHVRVNHVTNISCFGGNDGAISVTGQSGTAPYAVQWSTNVTTPFEADIENLPVGNYEVTVTDVNDCTATEFITLEEPERLQLDVRMEEVLCHGEANGQLEAFAGGGVAPYSYNWSNGDQLAIADSLAAGTYELVLTDHNDCSFILESEVTEPDPISSNHQTTHVDCYDDRNGSIKLTTQGGTYPYQYSINDEEFVGSDYFIGLTEGHYTITIKDANDCELEYPELYVKQPEPIMVDFGPDITVNLGATVQLDPEVSNTQGFVTYHWSPEDSLHCEYDTLYNCPDPIVNLLNGATYKLTVIDELDCRGEDIINIVVLKDPQIFVPTAFTPNKDNTNDKLLVHGKENIDILSFRVFDRWGELLFYKNNFKTNDPVQGWDGNFKNKEMPPGVYVWIVEAKFLDGEVIFFEGQTTLLR